MKNALIRFILKEVGAKIRQSGIIFIPGVDNATYRIIHTIRVPINIGIQQYNKL